MYTPRVVPLDLAMNLHKAAVDADKVNTKLQVAFTNTYILVKSALGHNLKALLASRCLQLIETWAMERSTVPKNYPKYSMNSLAINKAHVSFF